MSIKFLYQQNPKEDEDLIVTLLENDKNFLKNRKLDYLKTKQYLKPVNNFFMSIQEKYLQTVHFITKNAVAATIIMLISLTAVSASTAEVFAPEEFKPSTQIENLFGNNQQKDTNPYTALKPDGENDVAISDKCDLAIKYPKQIGNKEINIYNNNSTESETNDLRKGVLAINGGLKDMENNSTANQRLNDFVIACFDKNQNREDIVSKEVYQASQGLSYAEISKEELRERYGWFITEANMERIALYKAQSPSGEIQENILFNYQDKLYWMYIIPETNNIFKEDLNPNGVFGNQIQLQFNSLVKNEANSQIIKQNENARESQNNSSSVISQSSNSSQSDLVSVDGANFVFVDVSQDGTRLLQKEGLDGYYTIKATPKVDQGKSESLEKDKINESGKIYKIWGKINSNNEIVEITKVGVVNQVGQTLITPKNANNLNKKVITQADTCESAVDGLNFYKTGKMDEYAETDQFAIFSQKNLLVNQYPEAYKNVKDLVDGKRAYSTDIKVKDNWPDYEMAFRAGCSGFYSYKYLEAPQLNLPGADKTLILYTLEGQSPMANPTVRIFAYKGDNLVMLSAIALSQNEVENIAASCGINQNFDNQCYISKISTPEVKASLDKTAKQLLQTFTIN